MSVNLSVVHHCLMTSSECGRILQVNRKQQDVQSFADGNLQHKLDQLN